MSTQRDALIAQIRELTTAIMAIHVGTLLKSPNYGGLDFHEAEDDVGRVRAIASELANAGAFPVLGIEQLVAVSGLLVPALAALQAMLRFTRKDRNEPSDPTHDAMVLDLRNAADKLAATVLPFLGYLVARDRTVWDAARADVDRDLGNFRTSMTEHLNSANTARLQILGAEKDADAALERIRSTAAAVGVKAYSTTFGSEAGAHGSSAFWWLASSIVTAIGGVSLVLWVLTAHEIPADAGPGKISQYVLLRAVLIVLVYFVPLWCSRNYRAERHLQVVNRHRVNALLTFETFVSATKDEGTRNAVLLEATRCIFAQTQTGFLGGDESLPTDRVLEVVKTVAGKGEK